MAFERVYTVWDYWDGPRSGIAFCFGEPHYYQCEQNEGEDADSFLLTRISEEMFSLAIEQWSIFRDWEVAFHRGGVPQSTHPAFPGSDRKYLELQEILDAHVSQLTGRRRKVRATFRAEAGQENRAPGLMRELEVEWSELPVS